MSHPSVERLYAFHAQDREIFSKLVLRFSRSPAESLLVMATWFWFEDVGLGSIFTTLTVLCDLLLVDLADEAVLCFKCLELENPPSEVYQIPLTARVLRNDLTLQMIHQHRFTAITGIKNFLNSTCSRIFSDILQRVLPSSSSSFATRLRHPLIIPGFPHPTFGNINVFPDVGRSILPPSMNTLLYPQGLWSWNTTFVTNDKDRTIFLTFSRGFPVSQDEVFELFTGLYGEDCVERVYMQETGTNSSSGNSGESQALFARMVVNSVLTVDRILDGSEKKKYQINGKHIWARKFANREYLTYQKP